MGCTCLTHFTFTRTKLLQTEAGLVFLSVPTAPSTELAEGSRGWASVRTPCTQGHIQALPLTSCVTLHMMRHLPVPQFPDLRVKQR